MEHDIWTVREHGELESWKHNGLFHIRAYCHDIFSVKCCVKFGSLSLGGMLSMWVGLLAICCY